MTAHIRRYSKMFSAFIVIVVLPVRVSASGHSHNLYSTKIQIEITQAKRKSRYLIYTLAFSSRRDVKPKTALSGQWWDCKPQGLCFSQYCFGVTIFVFLCTAIVKSFAFPVTRKSALHVSQKFLKRIYFALLSVRLLRWACNDEN